ncbi:putative DNA-directed RNA polymerase, RBP11-like dimerization domain-containing protein [Helianthus annuus]|nr:putative DNA-directed RNA polymerase, RBP11-like dimerization domain-containing protein [Helianthus annuus]
MEHGSYKDQSASTFSLAEDHTPGERSKIYSQPRVSTCFLIFFFLISVNIFCGAFRLHFKLNHPITILDISSLLHCINPTSHRLLYSVMLKFWSMSCNFRPRVSVCGYSIPHPSEARVNIRVQTTGDPAKEVLKDSCQDLMMICQHVRSTFDQVVADFKNNNGF